MPKQAEAPIRIAMITYDWYPFDVLVRRMSTSAQRDGCEVTVICLRKDTSEPAYEVIDGVKVHRLTQQRIVGRSLPFTVLSWLSFTVQAGQVLRKLHREQPFDVAHMHNMPDFLIFAGWGMKRKGVKLILEVQDVTPELMAAKSSGLTRRILFWLAAIQERVSTAYADHVITVGWPFEDCLLERGVKPEKMSIILNSADPDIFPPERRAPAPFDQGAEDFTVAYWGTVAHRNGLDFAVRALALARQQAPHIKLAVQGRGESISELKALAETLGVADAITWTDPGPADKIVDVILRADAGIIPYRLDGFAELVLPTKAYELAWMQRPIIAARTAGIVSMFRPESMMLCTPEDPAAFAQAILAVARDAELRQRLVANASADYEPYRWEAMSRRYVELLRRMLGREAVATTQADTLAPPVMVMHPR